MRTNAMKKCAVGAMLFGGTLGAAQQASADLVWNDSFTYNQLQGVYDDYGNQVFVDGVPQYQVGPYSLNNSLNLWVQAPKAVGNLFDNQSVSGAGVMNAASVSINPVWGPLSTHSITKTAAIASGFSVSMEYASAYGSSSSSILLTQAFEVTAGSSVTITLSLNALNTLGGLVSLSRATLINSSQYPPTAEAKQTILSQSGGMGSMQVDSKSSVTTLTLTEGRYVFNAYYELGDNASHTGTLINFAVPAPGAAALLGLAGLVGRRRRR